MRKLACLGGAGALGVAALLLGAPRVRAADHLDSASVDTTANRMADINDVYAWMTSDSAKVNLALTVSPADDGTHAFGNTVQYVFHIEQHPQFGAAGTEARVICTFTSNTAGSCWVVDADGTTVDYVSGDLSTTTGRASESGKFRVFAGRRSDPFFFNLSGFLTAKGTINTLLPALLPSANKGCPTFAAGTADAIVATLAQEPATAVGPCDDEGRDCFEDFNVMAIVAQVDKDLLSDGTNQLLSVWASTHAAP